MKNKEEIKKWVLELAQAAFDKKGEDIVILDMEKVSFLADYFLLVTASNIRLTQSIADEIEDKGAEIGITMKHKEGYSNGEWVLLDFGDIICHVFVDEARQHFGLENLWSDATQLEFKGV